MMKNKTKEKLWVLGVSVVVFGGGVAALSMDHGTPRTVALTASFAGLLAIALWQTAQKWHKKEK